MTATAATADAAVVVEEQSRRAHLPGTRKPGFAPPEQLDGASAHPSADVLALGKLLTFLLTGQTVVEQLMLPSWGRLARRCTERLPDERPSLDDVEAELTRIAV